MLENTPQDASAETMAEAAFVPLTFFCKQKV
jgi:hypothetical protein